MLILRRSLRLCVEGDGGGCVSGGNVIKTPISRQRHQIRTKKRQYCLFHRFLNAQLIDIAIVIVAHLFPITQAILFVECVDFSVLHFQATIPRLG